MLRTVLLAMLLTLLPATAEPDMSAILARWRQLIPEAMRQTGVPGCSVAVVYRGKVVMLEGFGVTNVDRPMSVTPDTVFQLASCSKPLATTTVAALVGEGKLTFDTRIAELDPGFALSDPWVTSHLTLTDLCSHRSGLAGQAGNELEELGYDQAFILRALRYVPLENRFRSRYDYSNFGITAGVEAACQHRFPEVIQEKLFGPLGMTRSSARYADFERQTDRALGHILENGKAYQRYDRMPDAQAPAGGVSSTARDLSRFVQMQLGEGKLEGKQIIAREALQKTHLPVMLTGFNPATFSTGFYALGWAVSYDSHGFTEIKHSGAFSTGSRTQMVLIPQADLGIVILCNAFPSGLPEGLSQCLVDMVLDGKGDLESVLKMNDLVSQAMAGMLATEPPARPASPRPPGPAKSYQGTYANPYFGPARVKDMQLSLGPGFSVTGPLQPFDGNTFLYRAELKDGPLESLVRFDEDLGGFTLEGYNDWHTGHFRRQ